MKRRKAIGSILIGGTAIAGVAGGYEWYTLSRRPDADYLLSRKSLIAELADTIIPDTDTPGAKSAGAVDYIMRFLTECTDTKTFNRFVKGLRELEAYTASNYNRGFNQCSLPEKQAVLTHFEAQAGRHTLYQKVMDRYTGKPFFETLQRYTAHGYCISEKGATMGLTYLGVPGKYLSCIPLEPNQKAWATK